METKIESLDIFTVFSKKEKNVDGYLSDIQGSGSNCHIFMKKSLDGGLLLFLVLCYTYSHQNRGKKT